MPFWTQLEFSNCRISISWVNENRDVFQKWSIRSLVWLSCLLFTYHRSLNFAFSLSAWLLFVFASSCRLSQTNKFKRQRYILLGKWYLCDLLPLQNKHQSIYVVRKLFVPRNIKLSSNHVMDWKWFIGLYLTRQRISFPVIWVKPVI